MEKYTDIKEHILAHFINHEGEVPADPIPISRLEEDDSYKKVFNFYHRIWKKSAKNKYNLKNRSAYEINHK